MSLIAPYCLDIGGIVFYMVQNPNDWFYRNWDRSISYRCTYTTHTDISICIIGIDISHIGVPLPHIRIDLSALLG